MKVKLFNDSFQNYKVYGIPKAQLILTDVPYVLGKNAYASNPSWYIDGDNKNGESDKAGKQFFSSDSEFRPAEFMHFCSKMLVKEPKQSGKSPCMVMFCEFEQQFKFIELGKKIRLEQVYQPRLPQGLFGAGAEGQYEDCRQLRIRACPLP